MTQCVVFVFNTPCSTFTCVIHKFATYSDSKIIVLMMNTFLINTTNQFKGAGFSSYSQAQIVYTQSTVHSWFCIFVCHKISSSNTHPIKTIPIKYSDQFTMVTTAQPHARGLADQLHSYAHVRERVCVQQYVSLLVCEPPAPAVSSVDITASN